MHNVVISVFLCIPILGIAYWISLLLEQLQSRRGANATVEYDDAFYFVMAAAFLSTGALAANLIR